MNIALEAIDRLKITASSHERAFLIEVMGRDTGYLALMAGIAGGAEMVIVPEQETKPEGVAAALRSAYQREKVHAILVVAEGADHTANTLASYFELNRERLGFELRVTTLGHVQRGGSPSAFDRLLATRLGASATQCLLRGERGSLVGIMNGEITTTALSEVVANKKVLDLDLLDLARVFAE